MGPSGKVNRAIEEEKEKNEMREMLDEGNNIKEGGNKKTITLEPLLIARHSLRTLLDSAEEQDWDLNLSVEQIIIIARKT